MVSMKRNLVIFFSIIFFLLLLVFPANVFDGASNGLLLWFNTVLPTLLPFIIATNLLMYTPALHLISRVTSLFLSRLFHVSESGSFAIVTGFLCGYPIGSKITADLLRHERISCNEANYLLSFCNNTSPMFIISFVLFQCLENNYPLMPSLGILMISPVLCSFIFRIFYILTENSCNNASKLSSSKSEIAQTDNILDTCIMNGFETITKVGGYIILFSILIELITLLPFRNNFFQYILLPSLEITNGVTNIGSSSLSTDIKYILCLFHTSFGGWCAVAQTQCMISDTGLKIFPYIIKKLVTALVTSLLAVCYIHFLH